MLITYTPSSDTISSKENSSENNSVSQIQLSNFRALERRLHKISKPSEIRNEYFSSLKNYKECISTLLYNDYEFKCFCDAHRQDCSDLIHCFENPLEYFVMADKTLKLIPYPHISFINIPAAFQALRLPITQNNVLEKRLINSLKRYLNYNIPLYFRTLYKYRFYDLKDRNILAQGSQITPFDAPENSFFTICGNLFTYCEDYLICLSTNSIKELFRIWRLPYPKNPVLLKQLFRQCRSYLTHNYIQKPLRDTAVIFAQDMNNHRHFEFRYSELHKCFLVSLLPENEVPKRLKECNAIQIHPINDPQITPEISDILYRITTGNLQMLNCWATLFANISSCEHMTRKLFIVQCISGNKQLVYDFLDLTFYNLGNNLPYEMPHHSFREITAPAAIPELCSYQASGKKYFFIDKIDHLYIDEEIKTLKKIITGKPICYNDDLLGKITYTNTLPIICVANSHEDFVYLKNNYPCIELTFLNSKTTYTADSDDMTTQKSSCNNTPNNHTLDSHTSNTKTTSFRPDPYDWLRLKLSLYGLCQINAISNMKEKKTKHTVIKHDCILNEFISLCCMEKKETSVFTTAEELHKAYCYFYDHLYAGTALTKRMFIKTLKLCAAFEYKRPHTSRSGGNPYAFMGIELKENYKEIIDEKTDNTFPSPDAKAFFEQLKGIDQSITINYNSLPPEISTSYRPHVYTSRETPTEQYD